ncbi:MAG: replication-associated recombination protein A [Armatimonadetes bacterium]|nr:replication-associated recombination protein A [Armatimonadota bacterium]
MNTVESDDPGQGDLFEGTEFAPPLPEPPAAQVTRRTGEGLPRRAPARPRAQGGGVATPERPPMAERMRPRSLDDLVGMEKLVGDGTLMRRLVERKEAVSLIFWGPPGSGKTSLARILVAEWGLPWYYLSAVTSGIADARQVFAVAQETLQETGRPTVVFVDEIHRFNKAQQDAFLPYVEAGAIVLLGATTENPSFSVISPLLSRCRMLVLPSLEPENVRALLERARTDPRGLGGEEVAVDDDALDALVWGCGGDARRALNALDAAASGAPGRGGQGGAKDTLPKSPGRQVTRELVLEALGGRYQRYERDGETCFNMLSALHKSLRGGDADASVYWLVRLIEAGEDPLMPARRMIAMAAEDIGMADPRALQVAVSAYQAFGVMGSPEGDLALTEAAIYLARAPKSNASAKALWAAREAVAQHGSLAVPLHLRNAPTALMKEQGYGIGYQYPHDFDGNWVEQQYLPDALAGTKFYEG